MNSKKRIAFVARDMCTGGIQKALVEMAKLWDYDRYDVFVYLLERKGVMLEELDPRVSVRSFKQYRTGPLFLQQLKELKFCTIASEIWNRLMARIYVKEWGRNVWYNVKCFPKEIERFDTVIAFHGMAPAVAASALYRLASKKKALWIHGRHNLPISLWKFFDKNYCKFDVLFGVSQATCEEFKMQFPVASKKCQVLYNIINVDGIFQKANEKTDELIDNVALVTVGRLSPEKGQQMVPATVRLLLDAGYDVHWYLVGDGSLREEIECEIKKHNVADRVILLGTKTNPYPYIKNCDIYVQPSFSEGYCTTTVEAKILQKPIVTTDAPGMREQFVSGENGLIVDAMTPEALFEGIKTLLDHPEMRQRFIDNLKRESVDNNAELQKLYDFIEN